jgi:hypothetical protein
MPWVRCVTFNNVGDVLLLVQERVSEWTGGDTVLVIGVDVASAVSKCGQSSPPRHRRWSL